MSEQTYEVIAEIFLADELLATMPSGSPSFYGVRQCFTASSDIEAIRAGVLHVQQKATCGDQIGEVLVQRCPLPYAGEGGQLHHDYPEEFFRWDMHCLLPLDVFTTAFLHAAAGLSKPAQ